MACPALPTCGLAVTEAERALPELLDQLEQELERLGLAEERFTRADDRLPQRLRRPYNSDIGLVGRSAHVRMQTERPGRARTRSSWADGRWATGSISNTRTMFPTTRWCAELVPVLVRFKEERMTGESFGDFCDRVGVENLASRAQPR